MLACFSSASTAGSWTMPSSMPRKITLLGVGIWLNTGARLVGGSATGVGVGCGGSPRPGTRNGMVVVVGGRVVVVRGGLVVGGGFVVEGAVTGGAVVAVVVSVTPAAASASAALRLTDADATWGSPPPMSTLVEPRNATSSAVTPTATANVRHWISDWRRCAFRSRARRDVGNCSSP